MKRSRKISIKNMIQNGRKGFTLIEILIVVAIIAILASVVLVGLGPTQQAGRDARRISDLSEAQNGLELYYNKCGTYPGGPATTACAAVGLGGGGNASYVAAGGAITGDNLSASWPEDPSNAAPHQYGYAVSADGSSYVLQAVLENPNNSIFASYNAPSDDGNDATPALLACTGTGDYCVSL